MIASSMILIGSLLILGLAGYWMVRVRCVEAEVCTLLDEIKALDEEYDYLISRAMRAEAKLSRIIALETESMAHVGKKAVAIARGER